MSKISNLPLANLEDHGARLEGSSAGFTIYGASGKPFGVHDWPPDSMELETHLSPAVAPKAVWAPQKMLEAICKLEAQSLAIENNSRLSAFGKTERLLPVRQEVAKAMSYIVNDFAKDVRTVAQLEVQRYAPLGLRHDDLVGAWRDTEIRTAVRGYTDEQLNEFMRDLNSGEDRPAIEAILRSPLKIGRLEVLARNGWRSLRDREDPVGREILDLAAEHNNWAQRIVGVTKGVLLRNLGFNDLELFGIVKEFGAAEFFAPQQIFSLERTAKARAA